MSDDNQGGAPPAIEADPEVINRPDDDASTISSSRQESTASITSSILEYRNIHGRTYQSSKTTEYWAPNDDKHVEAFDVAHQWLTMMLGDRLVVAPITDNPQKVLDVGTGTGIWAIDFADANPSAEVIGIDISPIQPSWVPPNLRFEIEDAGLDWTYPDDSFDFIHLRYMHGAFSDWDKLYREAYRCLKPGGWIQQIEPDIEMHSEDPDLKIGEDHIFKKWAAAFYAAGDKLGRTFRASDEMPGWITQAGFTNITHTTYKIPLNGWPKDKNLKEQGQICGLYMDLSLEGFVNFPIAEILGWKQEEVQVLLAKFRSAIRDPKIRTVGHMCCVYGQKPEKK